MSQGEEVPISLFPSIEHSLWIPLSAAQYPWNMSMRRSHACPQPVSGGIVYIKYCVCKICNLVLCTLTTTDGRNIY